MKMAKTKPGNTLKKKAVKKYPAIDSHIIEQIVKSAILQYHTLIARTVKPIEKRSFYLIKRRSKKYGFIYNVKYLDPETGKILPTKYSTRTNDEVLAAQWAEQNKEACLKNYFEKGKAELVLLENFYKANSKFITMAGLDIQDKARKDYYAFMKNHIIPFFQAEKIHHLNQIKALHLRELKASLINKGLSALTINHNLNGLKRVFCLFEEQDNMTTDFSNYNVPAI
jgi:hypothetical protein